MTRLDNAGVNGSNRNLKNSFTKRGPVFMPLALKRRQHRAQREVLAQRMHVRPVVVQCDPAGIRMSLGFDAEPILDFAFLPVDGRQLRRQGGERGCSLDIGTCRIR